MTASEPKLLWYSTVLRQVPGMSLFVCLFPKDYVANLLRPKTLQLLNLATVLTFPKHDFQFYFQTQDLLYIPQCLQDQDQSLGTLNSGQAPLLCYPHVLAHLLTISPHDGHMNFQFLLYLIA